MKLLLKTAFLFSLASSLILAQGKTGIGSSAFEIMDGVFQTLLYSDGYQKLQLTITTREGKSIAYKVSLYQKKNASFFVFDSLTSGNVMKLLYNNQGQDIYAYITQERRFYHKKYLDRFENILHSGFAYVDIANASFIDNYQQKARGTENIQNTDLQIIENLPLDKGLYGKLNVFVDPKKENRVMRIDYYDSAKVLMKTLSFTYGKLSVRESKTQTREVEYPIRWDMADLSRGTVSTLEFFSIDKTARLDDSLFKKENIEK